MRVNRGFSGIREAPNAPDLGIDGTQNWSYQFVQAPLGDVPTAVTAVQGYLLIPFIACCSVVNVLLSVATAQPGHFLSAQLTQVG
jgi:hypothetical protein